MKNECNIVKDLLPLYIDGAVSEDSRTLVEEHTALCESCARERREMMLALPENQEPQKEQAVLKKAAKKLRRKHMRRGGIMAVAGLLLGIALVFGGMWLYNYLAFNYHIAIPLDDYAIQLSVLENDSIVMTTTCTGTVPMAGGYWSYVRSDDSQGYVINYSLETTVIQKEGPPDKRIGTHIFQWKDGKIFDRETQIVAINRIGPKGELETIYEYGVDESLVVPASAELKEYYRLYEIARLYDSLRDAQDQLWDVIDESALPFTRAQIEQDRGYYTLRDELYERAREAEALVPEWQ